jgi:hypothetical protein
VSVPLHSKPSPHTIAFPGLPQHLAPSPPQRKPENPEHLMGLPAHVVAASQTGACSFPAQRLPGAQQIWRVGAPQQIAPGAHVSGSPDVPLQMTLPA